MFNMKIVRAAALAGVLAVPMASTAAAAQRPIVIGGGLVNVVITDVIDGGVVNIDEITVTLPVALQIAATVCDVSVGVLAQQIQAGDTTCTAVNDGVEQTVTIDR